MTRAWTAGALRTVLANGLTVVIQPVPAAPAAAVVTRVRAGFFDEPDRHAGISHVLEHMFFKGTPTRGVGEIARATKAAGGYLNAGTSYDYTSYFAVLPARGLAAGIEIQADALRHAQLDGEELAREIVVIIEEARRKLDTPASVAQESLHALLYDRHRIRRWRIGTEEVLRSLTRDDLVGYYRSRYVPSRTILAVAGGIDPDEALRLVERHYRSWAPAAPERTGSPEEPPRRERRALTLRGDVRQSDLIVGWRGVPALHPDELGLDVAAALLSAGRASWLYRALREPGIAASVGAYNFSPTEVGVFAVSADLEPDRLDEALAAIAGEVARLRDAGPAEDELERARTMLRARWARRFESAEGRASELAAAESLGGIELLEEEYGRLLAMTPDEVRDAARRHLDPEALSAVVYHPRAAGPELTVERLAAAFTAARTPRRETTLPVGLGEPAAKPTRGRTVAGVLHVPLPGVDLLLRRREGVPTASLGLYRLRASEETLSDAGLGALMVRASVRGAAGVDAAALAVAFEQLGGAIAPAVTTDWFGFQGSVLGEHLVQAALQLERVLRTPDLTDEAVAVERGLLADDARHLTDDMFRFPVQLAHRAAFGDAGYGLPVLGLPETITRLTGADARQWHRRVIQAGRTVLIAAGDFDIHRVADRLAAHFGASAMAAPLDPLPPAAPAVDGGARTEVVERDKAQTGLAMLFAGPDRRAADRHAAQVWAAIAGGLGGRLFEALRDRRSLAYTVAAFPWQRRRAGAIVTYIATTPGREDEAREGMLAELADFRARAPEPAEVERAVSYVVGQAEVGRQSAGVVLGEILDAWLQGTGLEELQDPAAPYRSVTPEDVLAVASRYLDPARRVEGIVRGRR
jgi:zinc protease